MGSRWGGGLPDRSWPLGGNKVWADPGQAGSKCCAPCGILSLSQMVAAYFRFPLGVYALTTARSTGTPQISDDCAEALSSRLSLSHHHRFRRCLQAKSSTATWEPATSNQQPNMPSQEAGSNPAPGSGSADRQAQDAQGAGATSPPRTEQELAQVRTRRIKVIPKQKQHTQPSHSAIFPQPRARISPGWTPWTIQTPRPWAPFRVLPRP